jgi:hypothetical protein
MESVSDGPAAEMKFYMTSVYPGKDQEQWLNTLWNKK